MLEILIERWLSDPSIAENIISRKHFPRQAGKMFDFPHWIHHLLAQFDGDTSYSLRSKILQNAHIVDLFARPIEGLKEKAEVYFGLASFYQSIGEVERAIEVFEACQPLLLEDSQRINLSENLGSLYKKQKLYQKAIETWQEAARLGSLSAYLELAKYYEHLGKDPNTARKWVEAALKVLAEKSSTDSSA